MKDEPTTFCGCCGRGYDDHDGADLWCGNCAGHVLDNVMLWDATYQAQHNTPCPYTPKVWN